MNLEKLYRLQNELDIYILANARKRNVVMTEEELLEKTILALLVEVGELANATRCFKHWSTKGPESKERLLDELADIWHFYLSIGNQLEMYLTEQELGLEVKKALNNSITNIFIDLYINATGVRVANSLRDLGTYVLPKYYFDFGLVLIYLGEMLDFTDEEIEQAYLKKHEENYRRQAEGY